MRDKNSSVSERTMQDFKHFKSRNLVGSKQIHSKHSREGLDHEAEKVNTTRQKHRRYLSEINSELIQSNKLQAVNPRDVSNVSTTDSKVKNRIVYEGHKIVDYSDLLPLIKFDLNPQPREVDNEPMTTQHLRKEEQKKRKFLMEIQKARPHNELWKSSFGDKLLCYENISKLDMEF